jgi:hypothetical protein
LIRRHYFGWFKDDRLYLSQDPPDAPIRRSVPYTVDEMKVLLSRRRGVSVYWWPLLPDKINAEIGTRTEEGLRLERRG